MKKLQSEERNFFFSLFFFLFFFCFSLFKTTKICFGSTKIEIFYREKAFHAGKKFRKNDFAPSEKVSCYAPGSGNGDSHDYITGGNKPGETKKLERGNLCTFMKDYHLLVIHV